MKFNPKGLKLLVITAITLLIVFTATPYVFNPIILPGQNHPHASNFKGEWFNKISASDADYAVLNRWAHYYGYHGCEPEPDNCPYLGSLGQWKLLLSYLTEAEAFPKQVFQEMPSPGTADKHPATKGVPPSAEPENSPQAKERPKEIQGLVLVADIDTNIVIDLRYATKNNFTGKIIYPVSLAVLQKDTAKKLAKANKELMDKYEYRIKIWDAYRPFDAQQVLWDASPNKYYVADPKKGSKHKRGAAVDITMVDKTGQEVAMPTGFDDFSPKAHRSYSGMSKEAARNLGILTDTMARHGFTIIHREWWHYEDTDWQQYPLLNIPLQKFNNPGIN